MENELIKTKIENLIKETKQLKIDDVISYIKIIDKRSNVFW